MLTSFFDFIHSKLDNSLNELRFNYIYKRTPKRYKERAKEIAVKFITKTKKNKYFYQTITRSNGHKHKQWVKPLSGKIITLDNLDQHVIAHCDCNDFRYENEWLLWTKDASEIISSNGEPLQTMNPKRIPKFCKHLAAIKEDLYNRLKKD